jgi:hypothetical protein
MTSRARLFADLINSSSSLTVPAGTDAQRPESPLTGTLRYSTTSSALEVYNGTAWVGVGGGGASVTSTSTAPVSPNTGDMWHNTTNNKLYVYYNAEWIAMKSGSIVSTNDVFTGNGSQVNFTLSSAPTNEDHTLVAVGGVVQEKSTYSISGSTLTLTEAPISGDSIEVMIFNAGVEESATATPKISNIQVTDSGGTVIDDTAVDIAGGYIKITGTGFASGCQVIVNNVPATSTTFVSSTVVRAQLPATTAGTYIVYLINSDGGVGIRVNGVTFSATPSWVTGSALQGDLDSALSLQLSATGASTFALQSGSTLPAGLTLSSGGLISGTVTGLTQETIYSFTVVASDAENQDSPRTFSITITVGDTYFNRTTLAINGDVNTFVNDASTNSFPITINGDTKPSAFSPYNTNWSNFFNGSSRLDVATSAAFATGTGSFTVEAWVYVISGTTSGDGYLSSWTNNTGNGFSIGGYVSGGNYLINFSIGTGASANVALSSAITLNTWHHVAGVRDGSTMTLYIDGVAVSTTSTSRSIDRTVCSIGSIYGADVGGGYYLNGYVSNIRFVSSAVYTSNFTPSTSPLTAIANTQLLTAQSNRLIDNSTNAFTITKNGDVNVRSFGPFTETDVTTGSGYFDGTGDYLTITNGSGLQVESSDFTVELWYYNLGATNRDLVSLGANASFYAYMRLYFTGASQLGILMSQNGTTWAVNNSNVGTVSVNAWTHIAVSRSGTTIKVFVNGVESASISLTGALMSTGTNHYVGYISNTATVPNGYITDLRVIKGTSVYTSSFTPPSSSLTAVANTQLLTLQNRQPVNNHTFIDSSGNNFNITKNGNVSQGSFSPFSPAGWSNYFDGSGDYLTVADNTAFNLGSGDATIEAWIYPTSSGQTCGIFDKRSSGANYSQFPQVALVSGAFVAYVSYTGSSWAGTINGATPAANTWTHVAFVRSGNTWTLYVNGAVSGTPFTASGSVYTSTDSLVIGAGTTTGTNPFVGYISNARIVKGTALYTSNFTPSTAALTAITNTSLLTCQSNRLIDNSTNNFTITKTGDTKVVNFSPFKPTAEYSPITHGGSAYFDGTGDFLNKTAGQLTLSGNFTIEYWMYPTSTGSYPTTFCNYNYVADANAVYGQFGNNTLTFGFYAGNGSTQSAVGTYTVVLNQWQHHALVRSGTTVTAYVNGVSIGTKTTSVAYDLASLGIGAYTGALAGSYPYFGYISDFRIINGTSLYTSNFTPPAAPVSNNINAVLSLKYNNAAVIDRSTRTVIETGGDARVTNSIKKYGTGSVYFDGTGDHLSILSGDAQNFYIGSSGENFTIEMWLYTLSMSSQTIIIGNYNNWNTGYAGQWAIVGSAAGYLGWMSDAGNLAITDTVARLNQWVHLAVCRNGSTITMYVNGTSIGTQTSAQGYTSTTSTGLKIGGNVPSIANYNGYIDDLRFTKGYARYTANFTPPTSTFLVR